MAEQRLASHMQIDALRRLAEGAGGFGMVLKKGDATAGQILAILLEKGDNPRLFGRQMADDFTYQWAEIDVKGRDGTGTIADYCAKMRARDPDLWIIELDVAQITPLIAALATMG